jgi:putative endonuclease
LIFMAKEHYYLVYMLASSSRRALYTGVTNSGIIRLGQHRIAGPDTFAGRYKTTRLVYFEVFSYVNNAIRRETEIKGWTRAKKNALVNSINPKWRDLSSELGNQFKPDPKANTRSFGAKDAPRDDNSK